MASKVIHFEVVGKDAAALQRFYSSVFGWKMNTDNPTGYGMVEGEDHSIGGGIGAAADGGSGHVTFYVQTDDAQGTLRKVEELGGRVLMPLTEVAPGTTIALFTDPEGRGVGLL